MTSPTLAVLDAKGIVYAVFDKDEITKFESAEKAWEKFAEIRIQGLEARKAFAAARQAQGKQRYELLRRGLMALPFATDHTVVLHEVAELSKKYDLPRASDFMGRAMNSQLNAKISAESALGSLEMQFQSFAMPDVSFGVRQHCYDLVSRCYEHRPAMERLVQTEKIRHAIDSGEYEIALEYLKTFNPTYAFEKQYFQFQCYMGLGRWDDASALVDPELEKGKDGDFGFSTYLEKKFNILASQGKFDEAEAILQRLEKTKERPNQIGEMQLKLAQRRSLCDDTYMGKWEADVSKALARAARENKGVVVYVNNLGWRYDEPKFWKDVLHNPRFQDEATKHVVLLILNRKLALLKGRESSEQAEELLAKMDDPLDDACYYLDAQGRCLSSLSDFSANSTNEAMEWLQAQISEHRARDRAFQAAERAQGLDRAGHLMDALDCVEYDFVAMHYRPIVDEILRLDPENELDSHGLEIRCLRHEFKQRYSGREKELPKTTLQIWEKLDLLEPLANREEGLGSEYIFRLRRLLIFLDDAFEPNPMERLASLSGARLQKLKDRESTLVPMETESHLRLCLAAGRNAEALTLWEELNSLSDGDDKGESIDEVSVENQLLKVIILLRLNRTEEAKTLFDELAQRGNFAETAPRFQHWKWGNFVHSARRQYPLF